MFSTNPSTPPNSGKTEVGERNTETRSRLAVREMEKVSRAHLIDKFMHNTPQNKGVDQLARMVVFLDPSI